MTRKYETTEKQRLASRAQANKIHEIIRNRNLEKQNYFCNLLDKSGLKLEKIRNLIIEEFHSYSMVFDLLKRDYWCDEFDNLQLNFGRFCSFCKRNSIRTNTDFYLAKPQWWKLQYKFPKNYTIEQIKERVNSDCSRGFWKGHENRKAKEVYTPKNRIEWWINKTSSLEEAQKACEFHKQAKSPYSIEFYLSRGISKEDGSSQITKLSISRGLKGLKKTQKPKTEKIVASVLKEYCISYTAQYNVKLPLLFSKRRKTFVYDFYIPHCNLLIECNGTYWHADKRIYEAEDKLKFPSGIFQAKDIWQWDEERRIFANSLGKNFIILWELDITRDFVIEELRKVGAID